MNEELKDKFAGVYPDMAMLNEDTMVQEIKKLRQSLAQKEKALEVVKACIISLRLTAHTQGNSKVFDLSSSILSEIDQAERGDA